MTPTVRNLLGVAAGVAAAYLALAIGTSVDMALGYPRTYSTAVGELLLRLSSQWPFLLSAVVLGLVAGAIVDAPRLRPWQLAVASVAAAQFILSLRYVAPEIAEWVNTIITIVTIAAVAVCTFSFVARRTRKRDAAQTAA